MSLHLSKPAEWSWMLFGKGLRAMKKAKKWQTRLDLWMCTTASHIACESNTRVFGWPVQLPSRNAAPPSHGWAAVWETPVQHKHACMHACKALYTWRVTEPPLQRPVSQHTDEIQWMTRTRNSTDSKQANHTVTIIHVGLVACNNDFSSFHNYSVGVQLK